MTVNKKIKTIQNNLNKIKQTKAQYNLDIYSAKISALPSQNASKYDFLTGEDVLPEKKLLEKATAIKRFEYSPLSSELKTNWH